MNCKVVGRVFDVINALGESQKQPAEYRGQLLYHSEVEFLAAVRRFPESNVSDMSGFLRVTKGAVTQTAAKLFGKELVEIYAKPGNKKEKFFRLTKLGEAVHKEHLEVHERSNKLLCNYFNSLDEKETEVIFDFLDQLEKCVPFCEFDCMGTTQSKIKGGAYQ